MNNLIKFLKQDKAIGTYTIIWVLIVVFIAESFLGGSQNTATLINLGAMNNYAVIAGHQWWRLFTAQFLHIGIWHLVSNLVMIYYMGIIIEPVIGHVKFLIIYLLSGIGGNLLSLAFGTDSSISAGASTALFGLFGAAIVLGIRYSKSPWLSYIARQALALAILNIVIDLFLPNIDIWGHIGGLIIGILLETLIGDSHNIYHNNKIRLIVGMVLIIYIIFTIRQGMIIKF